MKRLVGICCLIFAVYFPLHAGAGTKAGQVLSFAGDARAMAMAEAVVSFKGDVSLLRYNPAGVAKMKSKQFSFLHRQGIADDVLNGFNFGTSLKKLALAVSIFGYDAGKIDLINAVGNKNTVNAQKDFIFSAALAKEIGSSLSAGMSLKVLDSQLVGQFKAQTFTLDLGAIFERKKLSLGFSMRNLTGKLKYNQYEDALIRDITVGGSYKFPDKITSGVVAVFTNDGTVKTCFGLELKISSFFCLRAGQKSGEVSQTTAGIGFKFESIKVDYGIKFGEVPFYTQSIGVHYEF